MRRNITYIKYALIGFIFCGCTEDLVIDDDQTLSLKANYLYLEDRDISLTADDQDYSTYLYTESTPWKFSDMSDWITVSPMNGSNSQQIGFHVMANDDADNSRVSVFNLNSQDPDWRRNIPVSISQGACAPYISADAEWLSFAAKGETKTVNLVANGEPVVFVDYYNDKDWITTSINKNQLTIQTKENTYGYPREASCVVKVPGYGGYSNKSISIRVLQNSPSISTSEETLNFENTACTLTLEVTADAAWTASTNNEWIELSPQEGSPGVSDLKVSVSPNTSTNSRKGYITLKIGYSTNSITVQQKGIYLDLLGTIENLPGRGGSGKITVQSNTTWTAEADVDWLSVSPESGVDGVKETEVIVTATKENPSFNSRTGKITFTSDLNNIKKTLTVTQKGLEFSMSTDIVEFTDKGGKQYVDIISDGSWEASALQNYDWFTFSPNCSKGDEKMIIMAGENLTTEERVGYIDVTLTSAVTKTQRIAVHQASKYFNVKNDALTFPSHGGRSSVEILTNDSWTATVEEGKTWLSITENAGEGAAVFDVVASDNASLVKREAYIDVVSENAGTVRLKYTQEGRYLTVDRADFTFFAGGGTSTLATIDTDGEFSVSQEGGWFVINDVTDNTFTVTASKNETDEERSGKITVMLTDLESGELKVELPVIQVAGGMSFIKNEYGVDGNWNLIKGHNLTVTVKSYSEDKSWNVDNGTVKTITFLNYGSDKNWNIGTQNGGSVDGSGYGSDSDWNTDKQNGGNVDGSGYGSDSDWNVGTQNGGNIKGSGYDSDKNWNNNNDKK